MNDNTDMNAEVEQEIMTYFQNMRALRSVEWTSFVDRFTARDNNALSFSACAALFRLIAQRKISVVFHDFDNALLILNTPTRHGEGETQ